MRSLDDNSIRCHPDHLIRKVAEELRKRKEITPPEWAAFAKTGAHKEMPPEDPDWWYVRAAAVLRRVYVDGPLGVERMRSFYGGNKNRGSKPNAFRKGSGSILRKSLQQLEAAGLIIHDKPAGYPPRAWHFLTTSRRKLRNPPTVPKRLKAVAEPEPKKAEGKNGLQKGKRREDRRCERREGRGCKSREDRKKPEQRSRRQESR